MKYGVHLYNPNGPRIIAENFGTVGWLKRGIRADIVEGWGVSDPRTPAHFQAWKSYQYSFPVPSLES